MEDNHHTEDKLTYRQEIRNFVRRLSGNFIEWLKPSPDDHWSVQILKTIGKIPVVLLLVALSPVLLVVLLLVFLIAL
ncbi:hypothetical protein ACFOET_11125 [Parapedobacter deserti]|uniref:DUF4342 domain-containing protein n=1 Tax=Parapedobacter deserti TaxID=1912957 RepID=A0ABV7JMX0_9SPHI